MNLIDAETLKKRNRSIDRDKLRAYINFCITDSYKSFNTETPIQLKSRDELDYVKKIVKPYGYRVVNPDIPTENMYIILPEDNK